MDEGLAENLPKNYRSLIFCTSIRQGSNVEWSFSYERYLNETDLELKKDLESTRESIEEIPRGSIEITLPISVQTVSSSISITGIRTVEGVKLMIVELMSFESRYAVKKEDKKVVFDDMEDSMLIPKLKND